MRGVKAVDLGKEKITKLLLTLSIPAIASQLVNALYNMIDRIFIGHIPNIGGMALTGVGVCFPIVMIISAFACLLGMGGAPNAGIYMGKGEYKKAEKIMGNALKVSTIFGFFATIFLLIFKDPILYLFGASDKTIGFAQEYLTIYAFGTIPVLVTLSMNSFISTQGFAKISMITVMIGAITNTILDPIFIYLLHMNVRGAALATLISQTLSAIWALHFLRSKNTKLRLTKESLKIDFKLFFPCVTLGLAPFIMQSTESLLILCFNSSLLKYGGNDAVGVMSILVSIMQFIVLPLQGLSQGGQPIISYNYGQRNKERVRKTVILMVICSLIYSMLMWGICQSVPGTIMDIFSNQKSIVDMGKWALPIYTFGVLLIGAQVTCQQSFLAFANAKYSIFLALFRKIILLIPLIYIMPMIMHDKLKAVFMAEPIADIIAVITTLLLFSYFFYKLLKNWNNDNEIEKVTK